MSYRTLCDVSALALSLNFEDSGSWPSPRTGAESVFDGLIIYIIKINNLCSYIIIPIYLLIYNYPIRYSVLSIGKLSNLPVSNTG